MCAWVWSGVLWVGEVSGVIGSVWVAISCAELFWGCGSLFILARMCSSSHQNKAKTKQA